MQTKGVGSWAHSFGTKLMEAAFRFSFSSFWKSPLKPTMFCTQGGCEWTEVLTPLLLVHTPLQSLNELKSVCKKSVIVVESACTKGLR